MKSRKPVSSMVVRMLHSRGHGERGFNAMAGERRKVNK